MTKLVYIGGFGRSGSTLLEALLTSSPDLVACGETVSALRQEPDRLCSCGRKATVCPVWGPVLASPEKRGGWTHSGLDMALLEQILASNRVMVDSSKTAWGVSRSPFRLRRLLGVDFQLVHLVRDPRAVCWSIVRGRRRRSERDGVRPKAMRHYMEGAFGWLVANFACEAFYHRYPNQYRRVRYEDLVRAPKETLAEVFVEILPEGFGEKVEANAADNRHQLFGNTVRRKPISLAEIREDDEWRSAMPPAYRRLVSGLTMVLRRRYGYT